ncbi:MAG TPA: transporter [Thermoleophilia bacterium]|nr:transporter [Thermoleophilia bacterium]
MRRPPGPAMAAALAVVACAARAQELEPRAYAPNPTGLNFALVSYGHSTGDVVFDPSVPITNTHAEVNTSSVFYGRTFGFFGRFASIGAALPYVWGTVSGDVFEQHKSVYRSGLGDLRLRFVANVKGGPALSPAEFAQRRPQTTLGASVVVVAPTGQYDPSKLINVGTHRWSVKPELGVSHPTGRWFLELYAGLWLFTDNNDFFGGSVRSQEPLFGLQSHAIYSVRRRLWLAADATFYTGGRTTVDGVEKGDLQRNSRFGLTASIPVKSRGSVKLSWARGLVVRVGGDFTTLSAGYQVSWF